MARISQYPLSEKQLKKLFDLFFKIVGEKDDKDEFKKVIVDLLSPVERIMIAKRIAIIYLLLKKIEHRNICKTLKVSSATVAKFSLLMEKSEGIVPSFKNMIRNEKIKGFLKDIFNEIYHPGVYGINWSTAWERKKNREREKTYGM